MVNKSLKKWSAIAPFVTCEIHFKALEIILQNPLSLLITGLPRIWGYSSELVSDQDTNFVGADGTP